VVAPKFLENPEVLRWLNGVEPAWTVLEYDSYNSLREEPSADNQAIRLDPNLTVADLSGSAVVHAAQTLLRDAADTGGAEADRDRQPVPVRGRGDVSDHRVTQFRQRRILFTSTR
jgi:hypothetical protein